MRTFDYLKAYVRAATWSRLPGASIAIETGTYYGDGALDLAKFFPTVHTIELSPKWHELASRRLVEFKNVTCHLGDSGAVLTRILPEINEPVLFYLDAHWSGGGTARGGEEVPLLRELAVICQRKQPGDIIVIDDLRLIGKTGECGRPQCPEYPPMTFDWTDITLDGIARVVNQDNRTYWRYESDRVVIFRHLSLTHFLALNALLPPYLSILWPLRLWPLRRTVLQRRLAVYRQRAKLVRDTIRGKFIGSWYRLLHELWIAKREARRQAARRE